MKTTTGRVAAFLTAGVILAAAVGFAVWAGSAPGQHNRAGFTAEAADANVSSPTGSSMSAAPESDEATRATPDAQRREAAEAGNWPGAAYSVRTPGSAGGTASTAGAEQIVSPDDAGSAPSGYHSESDPYLPPHAVVKQAPASPSPSRVYRPTNIVPTPVEPENEGSATETGVGEHTPPTEAATPHTPTPAPAPSADVPRPEPANEPARPDASELPDESGAGSRATNTQAAATIPAPDATAKQPEGQPN